MNVSHQPCLHCGSDEDPEQTLLCDGCDVPFHFYCLSPPLSAVPHGRWFCGRCSEAMDDDGFADLKESYDFMDGFVVPDEDPIEYDSDYCEPNEWSPSANRKRIRQETMSRNNKNARNRVGGGGREPRCRSRASVGKSDYSDCEDEFSFLTQEDQRLSTRSKLRSASPPYSRSPTNCSRSPSNCSRSPSNYPRSPPKKLRRLKRLNPCSPPDPPSNKRSCQ